MSSMAGIPEGQEALVKIVRDVLQGELKIVGEMIEQKIAEAAKAKTTNNVPASPVPTVDDIPMAKNVGLGMCACFLKHAGDSQTAVKMAHDMGHKQFAGIWEKALNISTLTDGGNLVPPQFSSEFIEELGAKAVVRSMGVDTTPMSGQLEVPGIDSSASASYVVEGANIPSSQPTTRQVVLSEKSLAMLTVLSNRLLALGGSRIGRLVQDHMVRVATRKEDVTFIRSKGTLGEPKGMLYLAHADNKFDANGTVTIATVTEELGRAVQKLMAANVDLDASPGYLISPRTWKYLATARDGNNNLVWKTEMDQGRLNGYPWKQTSQIPENLGAGTNESEVYFAAFREMILGESEDMTLATFDGGAYHDGSNVVSGISQNQTVIRLMAHHDLQVRHQGYEIAVIEAVKWGV